MPDVLTTLKDWSATSAVNLPAGGATIGTGLDDNLREIQGVIARGLSHVGANIASASTTDLGAVEGLAHTITGTTTITSFGTVRAGIWKILIFSDALTITHNATSLICPNALNIVTKENSGLIAISLGSGNWRVVLVDLSISGGSALVGFIQSGTGAVLRTNQAKVREIVSVTDFGAAGDGVTNDGPAFQRAHDAIGVGGAAYIPPPSVDYKFTTGVTVSKAISFLGGGALNGVKVLLQGAITGFAITASGAAITGFRIEGDRTTNQIAISVANPKNTIRDMQIELVDTGITQTNGNHSRYENLRLRNIKTTVMNMADGVGPRLTDCMYDTDTGTYAEPTVGAIVINCEGVQMIDCDMIHAGTGLLIEPSASRSVEWCLFSNSFFDSCASRGIHIRNNQASRYVRGLFFDQVWAATSGAIGVMIDGSGAGDIDGVFFRNCPIHNNDDEGVRLAYAPAKNIEFHNCTLSGNATGGTANNFYTNVSGRVYIENCFFGNNMRWTSTPLYHLYADTSQGECVVVNPRFDSNAASGKVFTANGSNTRISFPSWTEWFSTTVGSSVANVDVNTASVLQTFTNVMIIATDIVHASAGDLRVSFSDDGGATFEQVAQQRMQHATSSEDRQAYIHGNRTIANTDNIQGTLLLQNLNGAYKQVNYQSNRAASSSQGLFACGTIETTTPINFIRLAMSAGNITGGVVKAFVQ